MLIKLIIIIVSVSFCLGDHFLNYLIFLAVDVHRFGHVATLLHDELHLGLAGSPENLALVSIDDTLDWFVVAIASVVCTRGNYMRLLVPSLLGCSGGLYAVQVLFIESSVVVDAVFPLLGLFVTKVVLEEVLA